MKEEPGSNGDWEEEVTTEGRIISLAAAPCRSPLPTTEATEEGGGEGEEPVAEGVGRME